jgi:excinuclease ABC subunit A
VLVNIKGKDLLFSEQFACLNCNISYDEPSPRLFSFNSPFGACKVCDGLGQKMEIDPDLVLRDRSLSISEGVIHPWGGAEMSNWYRYQLKGVARHYNFKFATPFNQLSQKVQQVILYGSGREEITFEFEHVSGKGRGSGVYTSSFEGVKPHLERRYKQTESAGVRQWIENYMSITDCPSCHGARLRPEALSVILDRETIDSLTAKSIKDIRNFFRRINLTKRQQLIARQILKELRERLGFLCDVGLDYLTLSRAAATLSGGEAQRIRLATQPRSDRVWSACSTFSMNLRSACISATIANCSTLSPNCAISATPCWSLNMIAKQSSPPTMSSTWDPAPVFKVAGSWWPGGRM